MSKYQRQQRQKNKQELKKYEKENYMCKVYARAGHTIRHIERHAAGDGTFDVFIDGRKADLKRTGSTNNIVKYAKHAVREQGAELVLFQFDNFNARFESEIKKLQRRGIHGYYFVTGVETVVDF